MTGDLLARDELAADCSRCRALCCVLPPFSASADFAFDKPAGLRCRHLAADDRCSIHAELLPRGMPGCTVFDCFGAGQLVTSRAAGVPRVELAQAFDAARVVQELRWYLRDAGRHRLPGPLRGQVEQAANRVTALAAGGLPELAAVDVGPLRAEVGELLDRVSRALRGNGRPDHRGADLVAVRWRGADLRAASLRGALLLGADLRAADLRGADLLGADLRGADLSGARLDGALFLTAPQVAAARGDAATELPAGLGRPAHWAA